jgi:hypothetical protein
LQTSTARSCEARANDVTHDRTNDVTYDNTNDRTYDHAYDRTYDHAFDRTYDRTYDCANASYQRGLESQSVGGQGLLRGNEA